MKQKNCKALLGQQPPSLIAHYSSARFILKNALAIRKERRLMRKSHICILVVISFLVGGCQTGPKLVRSGFPHYIQALRHIEDEQMLTNLVRLRYAETPVFLQISSITTTFSVSVNAGASISSTDNRAAGDSDTIGGSLGASYSETPTITFGLPESREYLGRVMAPVGIDQLSVLAQAGWGVDRVLKVGVKKLNRLENFSYYYDDGLLEPASYPEFLEALGLVDDLRKAGLIDLTHGLRGAGAGAPFDTIDSRSIPEARKIGMEFYSEENGQYKAYMFSNPVYVRFSKASDDSPETQRLRDLLRLSPEKYSFPLLNTASSDIEGPRTWKGELALALDPDAEYVEFVVSSRSMMEIMEIMAWGVEIPQRHIEMGIADRKAQQDDPPLVIHSSKKKPENAAVRIRYQDHWYYIKADDSHSKGGFGLLNALFASTVGNVPGAKPVLTLPVN